MKTYEQFREEAFENPKEGVRTIAQIEAQAAKEYAKQWVEYSHKMQFHLIEMIKQEINAQ